MPETAQPGNTAHGQRLMAISRGFWSGLDAQPAATPRADVGTTPARQTSQTISRSLDIARRQAGERVQQAREKVTFLRIPEKAALKYQDFVKKTVPQRVERLQRVGEAGRNFGKRCAEFGNTVSAFCSRIDNLTSRLSGKPAPNEKACPALPKETAQKQDKVQIVWVNDHGDYIIPADPKYNPNNNSSEKWHKIQKTD